MPHMVLLSFISSMGAIIVAFAVFYAKILLTHKEVIVSSHLELVDVTSEWFAQSNNYRTLALKLINQHFIVSELIN